MILLLMIYLSIFVAAVVVVFPLFGAPKDLIRDSKDLIRDLQRL